MRSAAAMTALLGTLILGACAVPGPQPGGAGDMAPRFNGFCRCAETGDLLAYAQRLRSMGSDELAAEYATVNQNLARQKSDGARLRLALLLSAPGTDFHDYARAATLADEVAGRKNSNSNSLRPLALLLSSAASEQQKAEERNQKLAQRLQEEIRRGDALQQKLDELKAIEKNLLNREPTKPVKVK